MARSFMMHMGTEWDISHTPLPFGFHETRANEGLVFVDEFEVRITRKKVKRARIRVVPPDGHIEASLPLRMPMRELEEFIRSKRRWIVRQQEALHDSPQTQAELASDEEKKMWKTLVSATVPLLVEMWEPVIGVKVGKLAYCNMKSRWGSCQPATGRICINTRLALYPPECLEYVVVHEMCHLLHSGHGPRFWALVEGFLPDYRKAKAKLDA